jgi:outer membrane protein OmpA-like peptidoglycan-associated protein
MKAKFVLALASALVLGVATGQAQSRLTDEQLLKTLDALNSKEVDVAAIRKQAVDSVAANRGPAANLREPLSKELNDLAQVTVEINFKLGSAVILPKSFRTVGMIADALLHPTLRDYKFIIVGHTDATGGRELNLKLSEERAAAVREALVTTFGVEAARLQSVGLGEEQLLDRTHPDAAVNRRVQVITLGRFTR